MTIDLADYESGKKYKGDYADDLATLEERLEKIQVAYIVHNRRAIVLFEGWDAAGKGGIIQRMTAQWDPRHFEVWPISAPTPQEKAKPFLWRFKKRLPPVHGIAVFDRSWYGRVLVERVEGFATEEEWTRAYDDINRFEADLVESGTTLIKLFVHVTQEGQDKRLRERLKDPWKRWKTGTEDYRNRAKRPAYLEAMHDMFARTDTGGAPWIPIAGDNKKSARIAALTAIADRLEAAVDMTPPPLDPVVERVAREALGG